MSALHLEAELAVDCGNDLGESILWDAETSTLSWVDIHRGKLQRWNDQSQLRTEQLTERVGAIGLREGGGFVAGFAGGFALLDKDGRCQRLLRSIEEDLPTTRLNDGKVDRQGRFICGGMDEATDQQHISGVYRLDPDGTAQRIVDRVACTNSIAFSPDGTRMYFSDMPTRSIIAYAYDIDTGIPHDPVVIADGTEHPGLPDGSTVDADGCLWNARWGVGKVVRYTPAGAVDMVVEVPATNPTCPAFGGPDLATLYITSARFGRSQAELAKEPLAGSVFSVRPGAGGMVEPRFKG